MSRMRKQKKTGACGQGGVGRRDFLKLAGASSMALLASRLPVMAGPFTREDFERLVPADKKLDADWIKSLFARGEPEVWRGDDLKYIGMPVGGFCAGQVYLGGDGTLWHWDIFNKNLFHGYHGPHYAKPLTPSSPFLQDFALTVTVDGETTTRPLNREGFKDVSFRGEYPIGRVEYPGSPVSVSLEGFSPFIPLSVDDSSLPATVMRFTVKNTSNAPVEATLTGRLQNAACPGSTRQDAQRRNRVVREKNFTLLECSVEAKREQEGDARPDVVFEDWSKDAYEGWTVEGTAFGKGPVLKAAMPMYPRDIGGDTERVANSFSSVAEGDSAARDRHTGVLTSRPFPVARKFINVWIGGGSHKGRTCFDVVVDGQVVRSATGQNKAQMTQVSLEVAEFAGREARVRIVDAETGEWGHIGVGRITFSDTVSRAEETLEMLSDHGEIGLALLGAPAEFAAAGGAEQGFGKGAGEDATTPMSEILVGGLGRTLKLNAGESAVVTFALAWRFPNLKNILGRGEGRYYAVRFPTARSVIEHLAGDYERLYAQTARWRDTWYDSTLPYWLLDRTLANASTLASSTLHRFDSGKVWGWEGVCCCDGTCTHVWHYEQLMGRLFPELDINLREVTEINPAESLNPDGMIGFRGRGTHPAIDGQAGIILRCLRCHQVSPDDAFLKRNWPNIRKALEWLLAQDVNDDGILNKNQHNTLDAEWFGEIAWLSGLYLAALRAGEEMALDMGEREFAGRCRAIAEAGRKNLVARLWNGEYFIHVGDPQKPDTVGTYDGCHIDQVLGQSWAYQVGLGEVLPRAETRTALESLWRYNFTPDVGPYRKAQPAGRWYAMAGEAGTLMCSWPKGDAKRVTKGYDYYLNECMNGFEYQLAGHMIWENMVEKGLAITRAVHDRYHASRRNPWNEIECGDHYARSMAIYGVFLAVCGFEYHGPKGHIGFAPRLTPDHFKAPFVAAEGWGTYEQRMRKTEDGGRRTELGSTIAVEHGALRVKTLSLGLADGLKPTAAKVLVGGKAVNAGVSVKDGKAMVTLSAEASLKAGEVLDVTLR
jgi:non-lysosomal glucosylceramidase